MCRVDRDNGSGGKRNILKVRRKTWFGLGTFFFITLLPVVAILTGLFDASTVEFSYDFLHLLKNSLLVALLATALAAIIGIAYAFFIGKTSLPHKGLWLSLALLPLLIPGYIKAVGWITIFGKGGYLTRLMGVNVDIFNIFGTSFILGTTYFPIIILFVAFPLTFLDPSLEEAGFIHSKISKVMRRITFPLSFNSLVVGILIVFTLSFTNFNVPVHLGVNVYAVEIFSYFEAFYDHNYVFMSSLPVIAVLTPLLLSIGFYSAKIPKITVFDKQHSYQITLRALAMPIGLMTFILMISFVIPVTSLLIKTNGIATICETFSLAGRAIFNSVLFAFISTVIVLLIAFFIAIALLWSENFMYLLIPLLLPGTLMAIGLIRIMNQPWLQSIYTSALMLILIYVIRFLPIAVLGFSFFIKRINPSIIESACLVQKPISVGAKIILPLIKRGVILIGFVVLAFSLAELDATALLTSPGNETIPLRIFNLMHYGADSVVASLCIIIVLIVFALLFTINLVRKYAFSRI